MISILKLVIVSIINILPDSPFRAIIDGVLYEFDFATFNWFLPFDICATMTLAWIDCIVLYYIYVVVKKVVLDFLIKKVFTAISIGSISGGAA